MLNNLELTICIQRQQSCNLPVQTSIMQIANDGICVLDTKARLSEMHSDIKFRWQCNQIKISLDLASVYIFNLICIF